MGVRADHHTPRECIVFKYNLVYDACTRLPEADTIFIGDGLEEIKHFTAGGERVGQVFLRSILCQDKVIAVYSGRYADFGNSC